MSEQIVLGETPDGKPIYLPFSLCKEKHWLIRGKTGSGKSLLLGSLLGQLAEIPEVALFVCDLSGDPFVFNYLRDKCDSDDDFDHSR